MARIPVVAGKPQVVSASSADQKTIVSLSGTISYSNTSGSGTLSSTPVTVASDTVLSISSGRGYAFVTDVYGVPDSVSEASLPDTVVKTTEGGAEVSILEPRFSLPAEGEDCSSAIEAASALVAADGKKLKFPGGRTYDAGAGIVIDHDNAHWVLDDDAVIDGADVANGVAVVKVAGTTAGTAKAIVGPVDPLPEDTYTIELASAYAGLAAGDYVAISSDESWSSYQETLSKRETRLVASVSGTTVTLAEPLQDSYAISGKTIVLWKVVPTVAFRMEGGEVRGAGGATTQFGIELVSTRGAELRNVRVRDARCQGIRVFGSLDFLVSGCDVQGSNQSGIGYGIEATGERGRVIGNTLRDCRHGIDVHGGDGAPISRGITIQGNNVSNCSSAGLSSHGGAEFCSWIGNTVDGCGGGLILRSPHNTVKGNVFRGTRSGSESYYFGIWLQRQRGGEGQNIEGNIVDMGGNVSTNGDAINCTGLSGDIIDTRIVGNVLRGFKKYGIYLSPDGNVRNLTVADNIVDCRSQASAKPGIWVDFYKAGYTAQSVRICNNVVDTPTGDGILVYGGQATGTRAVGVDVSGNVVYGVTGGTTYAAVNLYSGYWGAAVRISGNISPGSSNSTADPAGYSGVRYNLAGFSIAPLVYGNGYGSRRGSLVVNNDIDIAPAGYGLNIAEGTNARSGVATLASGTVTVSTTKVNATSRIQLTGQDNNVTGALRVSARSSGTSFTITSSNSGDSGVVAWVILQDVTLT